MWFPFLHENQNYLIKIDEGITIKIYLTNFEKIWVEVISNEDLIKRFKECNPLFEENDAEILKESVNIFKNIDIVTKLESLDEQELYLEVKCKISDLPIKLNSKLQEGNPKMLMEQLTVNLVKTIHYLELKQNKLIDTLINKEREIQEYNLEFGEITRKNIITSKYEKSVETSLDDLVLNVFSKTDKFSEKFFEKHGDIQHKFPELKEIKVEKRKLKLPKNKNKRRRV